MASIVSQGKSTARIEKENFRDRTDTDDRIRNIYVMVAKKLKETNHPMPTWLIESLRK